MCELVSVCDPLVVLEGSKHPLACAWNAQAGASADVVCILSVAIRPPSLSLSLSSRLDDSHRVTVYLRDSEGRSGLHHAARMGN